MTIVHTRNNQELENEGEDELVPAAVRYTGDRSVFNNAAIRDQGGFPSLAPLQGGPDGQPGPWVIALIPSRRLSYLENHQDIEVAYDRETIAEAFLEKNHLPEEVFGPNIRQDLQERFLNLLEIERLPAETKAIREDLAEIAGVDVDPGEEAESAEFTFDLTRSELWAVSKPFDPPFERTSMQVTEAEDFLLEQDQTAVRRLVHQLNQGVEAPSLETPGSHDATGESVTAEADGGETVTATASESTTASTDTSGNDSTLSAEVEAESEIEVEDEPEEPEAEVESEASATAQRLDDEYTKDDLKGFLREADLTVSGNKDELIDRLIENDAVPGGDA